MAWSEEDIARYTPAQLKEIATHTGELCQQIEEARRMAPSGAPIHVEVEWSGVSSKDVWEGVADQIARAHWFVYVGYGWMPEGPYHGVVFQMVVRSEALEDAKTKAKAHPGSGGLVGEIATRRAPGARHPEPPKAHDGGRVALSHPDR